MNFNSLHNSLCGHEHPMYCVLLSRFLRRFSGATYGCFFFVRKPRCRRQRYFTDLVPAEDVTVSCFCHSSCTMGQSASRSANFTHGLTSCLVLPTRKKSLHACSSSNFNDPTGSLRDLLFDAVTTGVVMRPTIFVSDSIPASVPRIVLSKKK